VAKGLFHVILGRGTPANPLTVAFDQQYFLGIAVASDPEMSPRVRLATSAYSFRARYAENIAPGAVTLAGDVTGPAGANVIGNNAVTTPKIADNAVVTPKIADNAVVTPKIADNAVTLAKIAPNLVSSVDGVTNNGGNIDLIAGANVTITPDDAANTITIAAAGGGGGLTLPYAGSSNQSLAPGTAAFNIEQTGTGKRAGWFAINNAGTSSDALWIANNGTSTAADGMHAEAANGNAIECVSSGSYTPTIYSYNNGSGPAGYFSNTNASDTSTVIIKKSAGTGRALHIEYTGTTSAIEAKVNSAGYGIHVSQAGSGNAAVFTVSGTSTANCLRAVTTSSNSSSDALEVRAEAGAGNALDAYNNSAVDPTIYAYNANASATAPIMLLVGSSTMYFRRNGDITTYGKVQGDYFKATTNAPSPAEVGAVGRDNVIHAWARVKTNGAYEGYGCTVARTATGKYTVTFTNAFSSADQVCPVVSCRQSAGNYTASIEFINTTNVSVETYNASATQADCDFQIIVTGRY
jgi:hypothetical protein